MLAISGYGTYLLKTDADLEWFLPRDSYFAKFLKTQDRFFDDGIVANLYLGKFNGAVIIKNLHFPEIYVC